MNTIARINIWNSFMGAVLWDTTQGYGIFEYDEAFVRKGIDLSPVVMPMQTRGERIYKFPALRNDTFKGLPGLLADSLPDRFGSQVMDAWLARQGRDPQTVNPVERLCYLGKRGMGALEFEPALLDAEDHHSINIEVKELVMLAREVLEEKKKVRGNFKRDTSAALTQIIEVGTSAGGARAKAILARNEETGEIRSGQIDGLQGFDYWIIKFDGVTNKYLGDPENYGKIEYIYYQMAVDCGIEMMPTQLLLENSRAHFMTKRFDRVEGKKLHMQTYCGLTHSDYNDSKAFSYEQVFQVMRQLRLGYIYMEQLFLRMVFNVVSRNQDDHTKNIAFLMDEQGQWSLAPAYDMTFAYDPKNRWMKAHQMSVNGKYDNITRDDIMKVAALVNIKKPLELIDRVHTSVQRWKRLAQEIELDNTQIKAIAQTHIFI
jgi:serine/threonine-protein kinase HipA